MRSSVPRVNGAKKAVWGRAILFAVLAALMLSVAPAHAESGKAPKGKAVTAAEQAQLEARKARRHAKLDLILNDAVEDAVNGESGVIIEFYDDAGSDELIKSHQGTSGRRLGILNAQVALLPHSAIKRLANHPAIKRISKDREVEGLVARTAVTIGARAVQQLMGYSGAGIGVAIIDSGVTGFHDDLTFSNYRGQRVAHFKDFVNGKRQPYDDWGHGTHVAGIVGGNGALTSGTRQAIAPGANIIALKALDGNGHGTISTIIAAIDYAVTHKNTLNIRVINLSLGAGVYESYNTDPLTRAAKRAVEAGIVVVAAAGNLGKAANGLPQYGAVTAPGNAPWVLTVGASSTMGTVRRQDDEIASYSSRGPTMIDHAAKPDLVAPGSGTISLSDPHSAFFSTKAKYLLMGTVQTSLAPYLVLSGTSMSAPAVAGTVALMLQANPNLTPNLVKAILQFTAQVYPGYDYLTQGAGFLNARGAVQLAEYFNKATPGSAYPTTTGWSRHILWGNRRVSGGVLTPNGNAWGANLSWGAPATPAGTNIVWGENCLDALCDNIVWGSNIVWGNTTVSNIVWGNTDGDNIVWGNSNGANIVWGNGTTNNIVWGNSGDDNIVWGNDCGGADCDNIVWGSTGVGNIVWGNAEGIDNIVWGNSTGANIVWGNSGDDNIVWGNSDGDNIVWGNSTVTVVVFGDETTEVNSLPSSMWDQLFPLDAQMPSTTATPVAQPILAEPVTTTEPNMTTTTTQTITLVGGLN